ncbi:uncharacterized protein LOC117107638 [Anneissia japonica]|uniref:uncharacterized protein LOC117107638 n=1 Tax=Anneissia japonica TaxID=1529436 RepID=UPI0014258CC3|nr:uncharacterized protein LOC117107638 [Anneissia japonica]XP_033105247.1 uncharacterized protein LOC117107638 [Anneissia japonica]XP_033105255.1 uncharacterized protein LOC117107638 [Anneissia japonica]XP_033105263.1 uncharacterized protein LOC117107638 [Anneissia japonica]
MIETDSKPRMCFGCRMHTNRLLMSSLLIVLSWKFSTGTNGITRGLDSNTVTLSPALSKMYRTTQSELLLEGEPTGTPYDTTNNTFVLDALPMPKTGCQDSWSTARLSLSNISSVLNISEAPHFSHSTKGGDIQELHFCVWPAGDHQQQRFGSAYDNYCFIVLISIFNDDEENVCPDHFYRDTLFTEYYFFELSPSSSRVTLDRCCRLANSTNKPGPTNVLLNLLPPYYLLSANDGTCPSIEGSVTSSEKLKLKEMKSVEWDGVQLCYYEKEVGPTEEISWTLEKKVEISVYAIVLGTPTATLLVVCLCQIRTRSTKRKFAYRQSGFSSNHTQASVMFRQSTNQAPLDHQPSSSSLSERRGCRASTRF